MHYWVGLHLVDAQRLIKLGVEVMMQTTLKLLGKQDAWRSTLMLRGAETNEDAD
jgi:hypothetical protein